ncbi:nitroreductase family deazaflavin-dependent oxidoreductase [Candidatus Binatia bacterium]|nr:nitroreductase family deazaflavin-dependent oxidoreductase [Candidatus Binatia bacterium]
MQHSAARVRLIRFVTRLHETLFRVSGGRVLGNAAGMPVVMLTTTGRKSGRKHTSMLTSPVKLGDGVVLVASYGGSDHHPDWFLNLRANPVVDVVMRGYAGPMRARVATREEKSALWPQVVAAYSDYAVYQERTTRDIPLVVLERA